MTTRRGSRGGAGAPPAPATPSSLGWRGIGAFLLSLVLSAKRIAIIVAVLALLIAGIANSSGFAWGLSISFGIPLLITGLYLGRGPLKKLAIASKGVIWWIVFIGLGVGLYYFWWKPDPGTPSAIYDKEPRFLGVLWKSGDAPPYTTDGRPNYWATFSGAEWNDSMWALFRGPMAPRTLIHKLDPSMQACLEPGNVQTLSAGPITFTVCQSGPNGLPYFDATSEVRALAKAMEECAGNCDWVPGRLTATGISPDPGVVLINEGHASWLTFNTGRGDNGWGRCFIYDPRPGNLGDQLVSMSYLDMTGIWKSYSPSIKLPPGGFIEAQAFRMENSGPFPVPVSIGSSRAPRHMHGNLEGRPFVCLRAP